MPKSRSDQGTGGKRKANAIGVAAEEKLSPTGGGRKRKAATPIAAAAVQLDGPLPTRRGGGKRVRFAEPDFTGATTNVVDRVKDVLGKNGVEQKGVRETVVVVEEKEAGKNGTRKNRVEKNRVLEKNGTMAATEAPAIATDCEQNELGEKVDNAVNYEDPDNDRPHSATLGGSMFSFPRHYRALFAILCRSERAAQVYVNCLFCSDQDPERVVLVRDFLRHYRRHAAVNREACLACGRSFFGRTFQHVFTHLWMCLYPDDLPTDRRHVPVDREYVNYRLRLGERLGLLSACQQAFWTAGKQASSNGGLRAVKRAAKKKSAEDRARMERFRGTANKRHMSSLVKKIDGASGSSGGGDGRGGNGGGGGGAHMCVYHRCIDGGLAAEISDRGRTRFDHQRALEILEERRRRRRVAESTDGDSGSSTGTGVVVQPPGPTAAAVESKQTGAGNLSAFGPKPTTVETKPTTTKKSTNATAIGDAIPTNRGAQSAIIRQTNSPGNTTRSVLPWLRIDEIRSPNFLCQFAYAERCVCATTCIHGGKSTSVKAATCAPSKNQPSLPPQSSLFPSSLPARVKLGGVPPFVENVNVFTLKYVSTDLLAQDAIDPYSVPVHEQMLNGSGGGGGSGSDCAFSSQVTPFAPRDEEFYRTVSRFIRNFIVKPPRFPVPPATAPLAPPPQPSVPAPASSSLSLSSLASLFEDSGNLINSLSLETPMARGFLRQREFYVSPIASRLDFPMRCYRGGGGGDDKDGHGNDNNATTCAVIATINEQLSAESCQSIHSLPSPFAYRNYTLVTRVVVEGARDIDRIEAETAASATSVIDRANKIGSNCDYSGDSERARSAGDEKKSDLGKLTRNIAFGKVESSDGGNNNDDNGRRMQAFGFGALAEGNNNDDNGRRMQAFELGALAEGNYTTDFCGERNVPNADGLMNMARVGFATGDSRARNHESTGRRPEFVTGDFWAGNHDSTERSEFATGDVWAGNHDSTKRSEFTTNDAWAGNHESTEISDFATGDAWAGNRHPTPVGNATPELATGDLAANFRGLIGVSNERSNFTTGDLCAGNHESNGRSKFATGDSWAGNHESTVSNNGRAKFATGDSWAGNRESITAGNRKSKLFTGDSWAGNREAGNRESITTGNRKSKLSTGDSWAGNCESTISGDGRSKFATGDSWAGNHESTIIDDGRSNFATGYSLAENYESELATGDSWAEKSASSYIGIRGPGFATSDSWAGKSESTDVGIRGPGFPMNDSWAENGTGIQGSGFATSDSWGGKSESTGIGIRRPGFATDDSWGGKSESTGTGIRRPGFTTGDLLGGKSESTGTGIRRPGFATGDSRQQIWPENDSTGIVHGGFATGNSWPGNCHEMAGTGSTPGFATADLQTKNSWVGNDVGNVYARNREAIGAGNAYAPNRVAIGTGNAYAREAIDPNVYARNHKPIGTHKLTTDNCGIRTRTNDWYETIAPEFPANLNARATIDDSSSSNTDDWLSSDPSTSVRRDFSTDENSVSNNSSIAASTTTTSFGDDSGISSGGGGYGFGSSNVDGVSSGTDCSNDDDAAAGSLFYDFPPKGTSDSGSRNEATRWLACHSCGYMSDSYASFQDLWPDHEFAGKQLAYRYQMPKARLLDTFLDNELFRQKFVDVPRWMLELLPADQRKERLRFECTGVSSTMGYLLAEAFKAPTAVLRHVYVYAFRGRQIMEYLLNTPNQAYVFPFSCLCSGNCYEHVDRLEVCAQLLRDFRNTADPRDPHETFTLAILEKLAGTLLDRKEKSRAKRVGVGGGSAGKDRKKAAYEDTDGYLSYGGVNFGEFFDDHDYDDEDDSEHGNHQQTDGRKRAHRSTDANAGRQRQAAEMLEYIESELNDARLTGHRFSPINAHRHMIVCFRTMSVWRQFTARYCQRYLKPPRDIDPLRYPLARDFFQSGHTFSTLFFNSFTNVSHVFNTVSYLCRPSNPFRFRSLYPTLTALDHLYETWRKVNAKSPANDKERLTLEKSKARLLDLFLGHFEGTAKRFNFDSQGRCDSKSLHLLNNVGKFFLAETGARDRSLSFEERTRIGLRSLWQPKVWENGHFYVSVPLIQHGLAMYWSIVDESLVLQTNFLLQNYYLRYRIKEIAMFMFRSNRQQYYTRFGYIFAYMFNQYPLMHRFPVRHDAIVRVVRAPGFSVRLEFAGVGEDMDDDDNANDGGRAGNENVMLFGSLFDLLIPLSAGNSNKLARLHDRQLKGQK